MYVCMYIFTYMYVAMAKRNIDGIITRSGVLGMHIFMCVSMYIHVCMHVHMYIHVCSHGVTQY